MIQGILRVILATSPIWFFLLIADAVGQTEEQRSASFALYMETVDGVADQHWLECIAERFDTSIPDDTTLSFCNCIQERIPKVISDEDVKNQDPGMSARISKVMLDCEA